MTTPTLARRELRTTALAALTTALSGVTVESPPTTPTAPKQMPYVGLKCGMERKVGPATQQMATFTTTIPLEVIFRVSAATQEAAQDAMEALALQIELALLGCVPLLKMLQKIAGITTSTEVSGEGSLYQAGGEMTLDCELFEKFDPVLINPDNYPALQTLSVHMDAVRPYDANGIYSDLPFPDSVTAAPRTSGPDGRDEGLLVIDLPQ